VPDVPQPVLHHCVRAREKKEHGHRVPIRRNWNPIPRREVRKPAENAYQQPEKDIPDAQPHLAFGGPVTLPQQQERIPDKADVCNRDVYMIQHPGRRPPRERANWPHDRDKQLAETKIQQPGGDKICKNKHPCPPPRNLQKQGYPMQEKDRNQRGADRQNARPKQRRSTVSGQEPLPVAERPHAQGRVQQHKNPVDVVLPRFGGGIQHQADCRKEVQQPRKREKLYHKKRRYLSV